MRKEKNASSSSKRLSETTKRDEKEERERERVSSFLSRCYSPPFDVLLSLLKSSRVRCVCFSAFEALFSIHVQRLTKTSNNAKKTQKTTSEKETTD